MQRVRGGRKKTVGNPMAQLALRHQLKILCVECPLEPEASEPMLHCNGNKLAGPSFPNRSLPIASSRIIGSPKEIEFSFQSQEVGFFQPSCFLSFRLIRGVDYLLRRGRDRPRTAPTQPVRASLRTTLRNEQEVRFMIEGISAVTLGPTRCRGLSDSPARLGLKFCVATNNRDLPLFERG